MDYHAARVRLDLARAFLASDDRNGVSAEIVAAEQTAIRIGSHRLLKTAAALRAQAGLTPSPDAVRDLRKISVR